MKKAVPQAPGEAVLQVKVLPRSARNQLAGIENGVLKIKLTAPPVDGKANKALCSFLSSLLDRPARDISIVSGAKGRLKTLRIAGMDSAALDRIVAKHCPGTG